jgi:hypothetical protein
MPDGECNRDLGWRSGLVFSLGPCDWDEEGVRIKRLYDSAHVIPNHDHNYYLISDEVNGMAWNFLKKSQLKQPEVLETH